MSKLLINEAPIMIIPSLAVKIGLNEAIVLQQIHYWVQSSSHMIEGRKWIYNTYKEWQKQMPFWSESTIKRTIRTLEELGLLISGNWNRLKIDKTKWYTINYQQLHALEESPAAEDNTPVQTGLSPFSGQSTVQAEPSQTSDCTAEEICLNLPLPESTQETTSETNPIVDIVDYLNNKTNANYKSSTKKTKRLITARLKESFTVEDFKKVIDRKTAEWLQDPNMNQFLRPETLFGTKFESYLNQKTTGDRSRRLPVSTRSYNEEDFDLHD